MRTFFVGAQEKPNGVNSYTYNLAHELIKLGYPSKVFSFGTCDKVSYYKDVEIRQIKTAGGTMLSIPMLYFKSLPYLIKHRKEIDIVAYQTVQFSWIPAFVMRLFGVKSCAIIHSLAEDSPKHSTLMKKLLVWNMKFDMFFTKHIITISRGRVNDVLTRYKRKADLVPCGVPVPNEESGVSDILERNDIKKGKYFLTIGRIDPIKNLETIIDAFMNHDHGDYQLVIGGDVSTPYGQNIVERAKGCENIKFPGMVIGDDKDVLLRNCLAYCLQSYSEGLPIALLEGLSYGKLALCSNIPAITDVLLPMNIGLINDVSDVNSLAHSMVEVENSYEQYKYQEDLALTAVKKNYSWPMICQTFIKLINTY